VETKTPPAPIVQHAAPSNIGHQIAAVQQTESVRTVKHAYMVSRSQENAEYPRILSVRNARSAQWVKLNLIDVVKIRIVFVRGLLDQKVNYGYRYYLVQLCSV